MLIWPIQRHKKPAEGKTNCWVNIKINRRRRRKKKNQCQAPRFYSSLCVFEPQSHTKWTHNAHNARHQYILSHFPILVIFRKWTSTPNLSHRVNWMTTPKDLATHWPYFYFYTRLQQIDKWPFFGRSSLIFHSACIIFGLFVNIFIRFAFRFDSILY